MKLANSMGRVLSATSTYVVLFGTMGIACVVYGVFMLLGFGWASIVAGLFQLVLSWLMIRGS